VTGSKPAPKNWAVDHTQTKIEMLRVGRTVNNTDWLTRDTVDPEQTAPTTMIGPMKIGIRWKDNLDLDLYATARPGAETLFFQHLRSPEGYYYKDHRSSPGKEYEFIEFESPVDVREVEAFINFTKAVVREGRAEKFESSSMAEFMACPFRFLPKKEIWGEQTARNGNFGRAFPCWNSSKSDLPSLIARGNHLAAAGTKRGLRPGEAITGASSTTAS